MRTLLITFGVALAVWLVLIVALFIAGKRSHARELATLLPNLVLLFRGLLADARVPRAAKVWLAFAVAWCVSPIDLIPEFVPVAGPLDDAIIAAIVLRYVLRRTDRQVVSEHWRGDPRTLDLILGTPRG